MVKARTQVPNHGPPTARNVKSCCGYTAEIAVMVVVIAVDGVGGDGHGSVGIGGRDDMDR